MDAIIFLSIPLITAIIAIFRARKGKKSFLLLTIVDWCYIIFCTIALLNALGNEDEATVFLGFKTIVVTIIIYFVTLYFTGKEAKKNESSENNSGK